MNGHENKGGSGPTGSRTGIFMVEIVLFRLVRIPARQPFSSVFQTNNRRRLGTSRECYLTTELR